MSNGKEVITFKVSESLKEAMNGIPNRSEFIRAAILAALDSVCPLCRGTGILFPNQKSHWEKFSRAHHVDKCEECDAIHLVCSHDHVHDGH
ncbi:MAG: ribbon-helix-helix domain-containing protein [Desulfomonile sp.]